jgi:ADP-ribose pyrophosphatase YjhB (NUDIX family)
MSKYKTTCAIIINDKNEILLTKRAREPFKNFWAIPSGIGESIKGFSPEIGVIEEVRCDLQTSSFKGKFAFSIPVENDKMTDESLVFVGKIHEIEINPHPTYSQGIKWVSLKNIQEFENLAFEHTKIIKKYLAEKATKQ